MPTKRQNPKGTSTGDTKAVADPYSTMGFQRAMDFERLIKLEAKSSADDAKFFADLNDGETNAWNNQVGANYLFNQKQRDQAHPATCPDGVVGCHTDNSYTDSTGRVHKNCNSCKNTCELTSDSTHLPMPAIQDILRHYGNHGITHARANGDIRESTYEAASKGTSSGTGAVARPDNPISNRKTVAVNVGGSN